MISPDQGNVRSRWTRSLGSPIADGRVSGVVREMKARAQTPFHVKRFTSDADPDVLLSAVHVGHDGADGAGAESGGHPLVARSRSPGCWWLERERRRRPSRDADQRRPRRRCVLRDRRGSCGTGLRPGPSCPDAPGNGADREYVPRLTCSVADGGAIVRACARCLDVNDLRPVVDAAGGSPGRCEALVRTRVIGRVRTPPGHDRPIFASDRRKWDVHPARRTGFRVLPQSDTPGTDFSRRFPCSMLQVPVSTRAVADTPPAVDPRGHGMVSARYLPGKRASGEQGDGARVYVVPTQSFHVKRSWVGGGSGDGGVQASSPGSAVEIDSVGLPSGSIPHLGRRQPFPHVCHRERCTSCVPVTQGKTEPGYPRLVLITGPVHVSGRGWPPRTALFHVKHRRRRGPSGVTQHFPARPEAGQLISGRRGRGRPSRRGRRTPCRARSRLRRGPWARATSR